MKEKDKKVVAKKEIKDSKRTVITKRTRTTRDIELYDLETNDADLEYTRKFDSVKDFSIEKQKPSKKETLNKKKNIQKVKVNRKCKIPVNDIKVLVCGLLYLISVVLLIIGLVKYVNVSSMKECSIYLMIVMILVVVATTLISIEFGNKNVKTMLGVSISNKLSKKRRVVEYFKESIFISLIVTTFIAILIASGNLFIDFYKLTSNVALNVVLIFIFMYIVIFILCYLCCYFYSEHKISK